MEMNYNQLFLIGGLLYDMVHTSLYGLCDFGLKKSVDFDHIGLSEQGVFTLTLWFVAVHKLELFSNFRGLKWDVNFWLRSEMWY